MNRLKKLIKEALSTPPKKNCDCGGACCSTEITAPILKESKFIYTSISDGLKYHIDNKIPLSNNIYRVDSKKYIKLNEEARSLYSRNRLDISEEDKYFLNIPVLNEGYDAGEEKLPFESLTEEQIEEIVSLIKKGYSSAKKWGKKQIKKAVNKVMSNFSIREQELNEAEFTRIYNKRIKNG
jgi:hypothetical protein